MTVLALLRHGQSEYNKKNLFTGWLDVPLSEEGLKEAKKAKEKLSGFSFDKAFTSKLVRAINTLEMAVPNLPYESDEALNERSYGELEGKNKDELRRQYGEKQVEIWRRSFSITPPGGESLKNTYDRVIPYYQKHIKPLLDKGKDILVCAHGNSLRALIKYIEKIEDEKINKIEVPTGIPIVYEYNKEQNRFTRI